MATRTNKVMMLSFASLFLWLGFAYLFKPFFNTKMGNNLHWKSNLHCEERPVVDKIKIIDKKILFSQRNYIPKKKI